VAAQAPQRVHETRLIGSLSRRRGEPRDFARATGALQHAFALERRQQSRFALQRVLHESARRNDRRPLRRDSGDARFGLAAQTAAL
jgi:hypothetical protein